MDENLETFSLLWLDAQVNQNKRNQDAQKQLRAIINHLKTFEDENECQHFIERMSKEDRLVLIVSSPMGRHVVPDIHHVRQVSSIYVYCIDKQANEQWTNGFSKIKYVTTQLDDLISRIKSDQKSRIILEEPLSMNIITVNGNVEQSTTGLNGQCVHSHIFIDLLLRMKYNPADSNELISLCKETYKDNTSQLSIIREFENNYSGNKALWWYTRESFFYKMLNKALRIQNVDLLFLFHSFIRDIHEQLKHDQYERPILVYRGQLMSSDELDTLKRSIGEFVSVNSFLSTSVDRELALFYLGNTSVPDGLERVLFEIDANPCDVTTTSFADVSKHSIFPNESEILFMIGGIFRLTEIRQDNNQKWIIRMTLCDANEHDLHRLLEHMRRGYGSEEESTLLSLGSAMWRMGKYDDAEKYYRRLLKELPSDDPSLSYLYHNLGIVTYDKSDYDTSLQWYEKSLDIRMRARPFDYVNIGNTLNCIGNVHRKKGDHDRALISYNKAVSLFIQADNEKHPAMAHLYNNIGIVYQKQKRYSEALDCYQKSLTIQQKHLPLDHSDLGMSYNNIGCIHYSLHQNDTALEHYDRSLKIYLKSLPPQHPDIATSYQNIGLVYERKGEFRQALTYFQKAVNIDRHLLPPHHGDVLRLEKHIRRISANFK